MLYFSPFSPGLLTKDQIKGVFINLEELINVNSKFSEKLQDAIDIATEQGDEVQRKPGRDEDEDDDRDDMKREIETRKHIQILDLLFPLDSVIQIYYPSLIRNLIPMKSGFHDSLLYPTILFSGLYFLNHIGYNSSSQVHNE